MMGKYWQWKIGGEAGAGIAVSGQIFCRSLVRAGYHIFGYMEYPSLIRGGHNTFAATISLDECNSQIKQVHILVCLNKETFDLHKDELTQGAVIIYDSSQFTPLRQGSAGQENFRLCDVALVKLAMDTAGEPLMMNIVALGATLRVLGLPIDSLLEVTKDTFNKKGQEIVDKNQKAAQAGYKAVRESFFGFEKRRGTGNIVLTGNEATGLGAVASGCGFYVSYPMTPTSNILTYMAAHEKETGIIVREPEDEIAAVNMVIGASYAGVRSMTATAGGGFALMTEGVGLSAMTEIPLVVVEGSRGGPSSGMPTWTEQGDLRQVLNASQGDFPKIVLAPGDVNEMFYLTAGAFNLADKYQTVVYVLTDKYLAESYKCTPKYDTSKINIDRGKLIAGNPTSREASRGEAGNYLRYQITEDGISPRAIPGNGLQFVANSYEHNEEGLSEEGGEGRKKMADKRAKKFELAREEVPLPNYYGEEGADLTLVCWGSTKGPAIMAQKMLAEQGKRIGIIHFNYIWPFAKGTADLLNKQKKLLMVEGNVSGQMQYLIRQETGILISDTLFKYDGRPFYPEEIVAKVVSI